MTEKAWKRSPVYLIFLGIGGFVIAAVIAALFTFGVILIADFFLYPKPPSVSFGMWRGKFFERVNWTFITILWGATFFGVLFSLVGGTLRRWARKKVGGE